MPAPCNRTYNSDFLQGSKFTMTFTRIPGVTFFLSKVTLPSISLPSPTYFNPMIRLPLPGEQLQFSDLEISFKMPTDLAPYKELYNWIVGTGKKDFSEHNKMIAQSQEKSVYSDAYLNVHTNLNNASSSILFKECVPTYLGDIPFDIEATAETIIECAATFKYSYFEFSIAP